MRVTDLTKLRNVTLPSFDDRVPTRSTHTLQGCLCRLARRLGCILAGVSQRGYSRRFLRQVGKRKTWGVKLFKGGSHLGATQCGLRRCRGAGPTSCRDGCRNRVGSIVSGLRGVNSFSCSPSTSTTCRRCGGRCAQRTGLTGRGTRTGTTTVANNCNSDCNARTKRGTCTDAVGDLSGILSDLCDRDGTRCGARGDNLRRRLDKLRDTRGRSCDRCRGSLTG